MIKEKGHRMRKLYVFLLMVLVEACSPSGYEIDGTVNGISEKLHLNRSYFSELFRRSTGKSPGKYLSEFRMQRAAELLIKHKCNVTVTANSVGYPDVFSFSRAFRNHFGCSPTEYSGKYPDDKKS